MPKVSVIIPLYKTEKYVEKCIRSVMSQTLEDIEIICVDDCSPDASADIVEKLAKSDERIRLIRHEKNLGLGGARNTGILAATAEYIASVDSDDYIDENMLEHLVAGTHGGHFDVVCCGYDRVDEDGNVLGEHLRKVTTIDPIPTDQNPYKISNPAFWNKLWRRKLYVENEIFFPNHIYYQDAATTPRIYTYTKNINFIGGGYYKYLIRSSSVTNQISDKHILDKFRELDFVKEFFLERNLYGRYQEAFKERVVDTFRHHWLSIIENNPQPEGQVLAYLRHLILLREAYLRTDDAVRGLTLQDMEKVFKSGAIDIHRLAARSDGIPTVSRSKAWTANPKVLVLTLHAGENEFEQSKASLAAQTYNNWDHKIFSGLGNVEAHRTLYETVMSNSDSYDLFLKLDADMLFADENVLSSIVDKFVKNPSLDHFVVGCNDWMTGKQILGVHTYSNRVRWEQRDEELFVDPSPTREGDRIIDSKPARTYFLHSPDPSLFQAFHFGAHRALKVRQPGRSVGEKQTGAIRTQWDVFCSVWEQFSRGQDLRHGLALLGAHLVFSGAIGNGVHDYRDTELKDAFERYRYMTAYDLLLMLRVYWEGTAARRTYFERAVGPEGMKKIRIEEKYKKLASIGKKKGSSVSPELRIKNDALRSALTFRLYATGVSPFLDNAAKRKLSENPVKFLADAKHPIVKLGKWLHSGYIKGS